MSKLILPKTPSSSRREAVTPVEGEVFYDAEAGKVFYGDGATPGGKEIGSGAGGGGASLSDIWLYGGL